jgi:beta-lactamase regulating signal transducer with metallopeptidase domain
MQDVEELIGELVRQSFPKIQGIRFAISLEASETGIAEMHLDRANKVASVSIDPMDLSQMNRDELVGCLAHELCHVERDWRRGWWTSVFDWLYWRFPAVLSWEERSVDREAVRRGYGPELLAILAYHDRNYVKYDRADGLTAEEIEREMAQSPSDRPA